MKFSFIVIGRNESWRISQCLKSIIDLIQYQGIECYEITYVDSCSTDDTIERVMQFPKVRCVNLIGDYNSAIGRNVGAELSTGDIFIFIDGDIVLNEDAFSYILTEEELKYDFITGHIIDVLYNSKFEMIGEFPRTFRNESSRENQTDIKEEVFVGGAIMVCKRHIWENIGGMNTKYRRSQDRDLSLRLMESRVKILRRKEVFAKHHTIGYTDRQRMWKMIFDGSPGYRALLLRDHFRNFKYLKVFIREEYTLIALIFSIVLSFSSILFFLIYIVLITFRSILKRNNSSTNILDLFVYFLLRDLMVLFALFLFWPKYKVQQYEIL